MIAVGIVCCYEVVFSFPEAYAGVCPVGGDRKFKMRHLHKTGNLISTLFAPVNVVEIPFNVLKSRTLVGISGKNAVIVKFLGAGCLYRYGCLKIDVRDRKKLVL